jgi:hypothetical protein
MKAAFWDRIGDVKKSVSGRVGAAFLRSPFAFIFFLLWVYALYIIHDRSRDLSRVCELLGDHVASYEHPLTPQEEIDTICNRNTPDDDDYNPFDWFF